MTFLQIQFVWLFLGKCDVITWADINIFRIRSPDLIMRHQLTFCWNWVYLLFLSSCGGCYCMSYSRITIYFEWIFPNAKKEWFANFARYFFLACTAGPHWQVPKACSVHDTRLIPHKQPHQMLGSILWENSLKAWVTTGQAGIENMFCCIEAVRVSFNQLSMAEWSNLKVWRSCPEVHSCQATYTFVPELEPKKFEDNTGWYVNHVLSPS